MRKLRAQLFGSGAIMFEVLKAQEILGGASTASPPMFGALPATKSYTATAMIASDGTCCIPARRQRSHL